MARSGSLIAVPRSLVCRGVGIRDGRVLPRLLVIERPQRSEPEAAHDLDNEREKESHADATVERQQTAERGGEGFW